MGVLDLAKRLCGSVSEKTKHDAESDTPVSPTSDSIRKGMTESAAAPVGSQELSAVNSSAKSGGVEEKAGAANAGAELGITVLAHQELIRIRKEMPAIFERAAKKIATGEVELIGWGLTLPRVQKLAPEHETKPWHFVGDIHGDFLALHRLLQRVFQEQDFRLCFLGDLIDRGPMHIECFAALLDAVEKHPHQIMWVLGNHDDGVRWNWTDRKFFAARGIEPAEFVAWLNTPPEGYKSEQVQAWGRLFLDIAARLPRAMLFNDGLLATHGGVPLADRWPFLKTMEAFHHTRCLDDFTWSRLVNYPKRVGWTTERRQNSSDFGLGYLDLEGFCQTAQSVFPVSRVVCGHEHIENGWEKPDCYKKIPVLKINGFGFDYLNNSVSKYRTSIVIGIGKSGQLPKVENVPFSPEEYSGVYLLAHNVSVTDTPIAAKCCELTQGPVLDIKESRSLDGTISTDGSGTHT